MVASQSLIFSPPQKCEKIVSLIIYLNGKGILTAMPANGFDKLTNDLFPINLKSKKAFVNSALDFDSNAISVFSNDTIHGF
jgi:hypothetical protein